MRRDHEKKKKVTERRKDEDSINFLLIYRKDSEKLK